MIDMDNIRMECMSRIKRLSEAHTHLCNALDFIDLTGENIEAAWDGWGGKLEEQQRHFRFVKRQGIDALHVFAAQQRGDVEDDLQAAVVQLGKLVARDVITPVARESTEPVVALTGNSYMPPLRSIEEAEVVWQCDTNTSELFVTFVQSVEEELRMQGVELGSPDYDNMLYVIDLRRWQYIGDDNDDPNDWLDSTRWQAIAH